VSRGLVVWLHLSAPGPHENHFSRARLHGHPQNLQNPRAIGYSVTACAWSDQIPGPASWVGCMGLFLETGPAWWWTWKTRHMAGLSGIW